MTKSNERKANMNPEQTNPRDEAEAKPAETVQPVELTEQESGQVVGGYFVRNGGDNPDGVIASGSFRSN